MKNSAQLASEPDKWEIVSGFTRFQKSLWDIPFPNDDRVLSEAFLSEADAAYGVSVYRFSNDEARFVLRGNLETAQDLEASLAIAEKLAHELGCRELVTQEKLRPDWLEAEHTFGALGFAQLDASLIFECPFGKLAERSARVMRALQRRNGIPKEAQVTSLKAGRKIARSILEEALLMDGFDFDNRLTAAAAKHISEDYSQLVWLGDTLLGIILVAPTSEENVYEIPIRFIVPSYRQSWVNALLIDSCVIRGEARSATAIRFNANADTHRETIRLAKHAGGTLIASSHRYGKRILC
jgi:hypothetical protein